MYARSARFYDVIYHWKNYAAEAALLIDIVERFNPGAASLLDVACGSGRHIELLRPRFQCEGLDLAPEFVQLASDRNPGCAIHQGDFTSFEQDQRYDVVTCLFSAIGYAMDRLDEAVACMARHLKPNGVLLIEPWFTPEQFQAPSIHQMCTDFPDIKIARSNLSLVRERTSVMEMHHLVTTLNGVEHFVETHELMLYTPGEYRSALEKANLRTEWDPEGLMGRGLWIGQALA